MDESRRNKDFNPRDDTFYSDLRKALLEVAWLLLVPFAGTIAGLLFCLFIDADPLQEGNILIGISIIVFLIVGNLLKKRWRRTREREHKTDQETTSRPKSFYLVLLQALWSVAAGCLGGMTVGYLVNLITFPHKVSILFALINGGIYGAIGAIVGYHYSQKVCNRLLSRGVILFTVGFVLAFYINYFAVGGALFGHLRIQYLNVEHKMKALAAVIEDFKKKNGRYPTTQEGLSVLPNHAENIEGVRYPYYGTLKRDAFKADGRREFEYGTRNPLKGYIITSYGPDGDSDIIEENYIPGNPESVSLPRSGCNWEGLSYKSIGMLVLAPDGDIYRTESSE
jgi:MFS family permease